MGLSQLRALELEPATPGSQELAHLELGGKLGAGGSGSCLASVPVPDRLVERHSRASCRACEGRLWREMPPSFCAHTPPRASPVLLPGECSGSLRPWLCSPLTSSASRSTYSVQGHRRPGGGCEPRHRHTRECSEKC